MDSCWCPICFTFNNRERENPRTNWILMKFADKPKQNGMTNTSNWLFRKHQTTIWTRQIDVLWISSPQAVQSLFIKYTSANLGDYHWSQCLLWEKERASQKAESPWVLLRRSQRDQVHMHSSLCSSTLTAGVSPLAWEKVSCHFSSLLCDFNIIEPHHQGQRKPREITLLVCSLSLSFSAEWLRIS